MAQAKKGKLNFRCPVCFERDLDIDMFYDEETKEALAKCAIEFIDDPNFGTGLTIRDPTFEGCASCGGGCH